MRELPAWMQPKPGDDRIVAWHNEQRQFLAGKRWRQLPRLTHTTPEQASQIVGRAKGARATSAKDGFFSTTRLSQEPDVWCVKAGQELTVWDMSGRHPFLLHKEAGFHGELQACYVPRRIRQYCGTCYYNAALHALVCGPRLAAVLLQATMEAVSLLPDEERRTVMTQPLFNEADVCRPLVTWTDTLRLLFTLLSDEAPSKVGTYGMSAIPTSASSNIVTQLVHASGFRPPGAAVDGGSPEDVVVHLLARLGVSCKHAYSIRQSRKSSNTSAGAAAQVLMRTLPNPFFERSVVDEGARYRLESCVLQDTEHVIVGLFCGGAPYVYDSNRQDIQPYDWTTMEPTLGGERWHHRCLLYARLQ